MTLMQRSAGIVSGFKVVGFGFVVLALLIGVVTIFSAWFTVPEGHVGVVQKFGKSVRMETPGFHWKMPWIESVVELEVRERADGENLAAATANQLPATADVSMNWSLNKDAVMETYVRYGSLDQFVSRIIMPRLRSASKAAISRFPADRILSERLDVVAEIRLELEKATQELPIQITSVQLENVSLPERYRESVLAKEKAREDAEKERHKLAQQKLIAQQQVQTAEAERDARMAAADGRAYEKRTLADAESYRVKTEYTGRAEGVQTLKQELTPEYIDYLHAQTWNGQLPQTMLGDGSGVLLSFPAAK